MARLSTQGRLKLLFNGEGLTFGVDVRDPFQLKSVRNESGVGFRVHKRKIGFLGGGRAGILPFFLTKSSNPGVKVGQIVHHEWIHDDDEDEEGDEDYDSEFEMDDLSCFRGLVLDFSYRPINVVCWKRAICLEFLAKADVLEYYDQTVNSPSRSFSIPAVLRVPHMLPVVKRRRVKHTLSRKAILRRDNFTCQYCKSCENLTVDHVLPISRGGEWKWENLVTACAKCNSQKGNLTLEEAAMELIKLPKAPKDYNIIAIPLTEAAIRVMRMRYGTPEEWRRYLSPSSEP